MAEYQFLEPKEFLKVTFMEVSTGNPYLMYMEFSDGSYGKADVSHLLCGITVKNYGRFYLLFKCH